MHETFEHTADVGLRMRAATLNELFAEAGRALASLLVEDVSAIVPRAATEVTLRAGRIDDLLFDWLAELVYMFSAKRLIFASFAVDIRGTALTALLRGEVFDPGRHGSGTEVKAVTYHGLKVQQEGDGFLAEVIVDI